MGLVVHAARAAVYVRNRVLLSTVGGKFLCNELSLSDWSFVVVSDRVDMESLMSDAKFSNLSMMG